MGAQGRIKRMTLLAVLTLMLWLAGRPAAVQAGPGKVYSDLTASDTNTDAITDVVIWKTFGYPSIYYAGVGISDATAYSPAREFSNGGTITISQQNLATQWSVDGIVSDNSTIAIRNTAGISLTLEGTQMGVYSRGIMGRNQIVNSGAVQLQITGGSVTNAMPVQNADGAGLYSMAGTIYNSGAIQIHTQGGVGTSNGHAKGTSQGIRMINGNVENSGTIRVTAVGGQGTGATSESQSTAMGIVANGNVRNTAPIIVHAEGGLIRPNASSAFTGSDAFAYGIRMNGSGTLHSQGLITVSAAGRAGYAGAGTEAYQVHVTTGTTTITAYAAQLGRPETFTSTYQGSIKVDSGGALAFNNAVLHLTLSPDFPGMAEVEIPMLAENAPAADQFVQVQGLPAPYSATLMDGGGAGLQKLSLAFTPRMSMSNVSAQAHNEFNARSQAMVGARVRQGAMGDLPLADSLALGDWTPGYMERPDRVMARLESEQGWLPGLGGTWEHQVFVSPVALVSDGRGNPGYRAENYGLLAGYTRAWAERFSLGLHAGVLRNHLDYRGEGFNNRYERGNTYVGGGHFTHCPTPDWMISTMVSGFYSDTDYWDLSATNPETAAYSSWSLRGDLSVGRFYRFASGILLPELGLAAVYNHRESYTTQSPVNPGVTHESSDETELYGRLGVKWLDRFEAAPGWEVRPVFGIGVSQTLTNGRYSDVMRVGELSQLVEQGSDTTHFTPEFSLSITRGAGEFMVGYSGGYSRNTENYLVWARLGFGF